MRLRPESVGASAVYVVLGLAWALLTGVQWWWAQWFVVVGIAGAFVPGLANQVTLARAYLAAPALLYALRGDFGFLAVCVALAGLTDMVDGTVARRFAVPSQLGGALDPVVDGLFMGALVVGLAVGGTLPWWLSLVVIARYLLPALAGGLLMALGRRPELKHTLTGQVSTTLILVLIGGVCLLQGLHQDAGGLLLGAEVVLPVATVATYVHLGLSLRRR